MTQLSKYIGAKFNYLTVLELQKAENYHINFKCRCDCGNIIIRNQYVIRKGKVKTCGPKCPYHHMLVNRLKNHIGYKFNYLTVIDHFVKNRISYFSTRCDCGNITNKQAAVVINGKVKTCGPKCIYHHVVLNDMMCNTYASNVGIIHGSLQITDFIIHKHNRSVYICKCLKCGNSNFEIRISQFNQFKPILCNKCSSKSNSEHLFNLFLQTEDIPYDCIRIESKSSIQSKIEIDFMIDGCNVGVELHGLITHATTKGDYDSPFIGNKHRTYHLNKTESCEDEGIDLIQFWNTEWIQKPDICKSIILNRLNKPKYRSYARKCVIREIDKSTYNSFMETNHLQGSTRGESVRLGLFYKENDTLVSVMSFGHSRFSGHQWEMFRFASYVYCQIVGAASKLFKHFIRNYQPDNIVSYSDRRVFNSGGLYDTLGFKHSHNSDPSYWYFKKNQHQINQKLYHRSTFMKHKLKDKLATFDPNLSEWENMELNGYLRVYDCGNNFYTLCNK